MLGFRLKVQRPPDPNPVKEGVVMRFDHVYEIDPASMKLFKQQDIPAWDTMRIVSNRWEHLHWMHLHFAESVISGEELEKELEKENKARGKRRTAKKKRK